MILCGVLALRADRLGWRAFVRDHASLRYAVLALAPSAAFVAIGGATGLVPSSDVGDYFIGSLLHQASFWHDWLTQISDVITLPLLAVALVGILVLAPRPVRVLGVGSLVGYAAFGLSVDYRVATHSYYSLPLVPVVALGIGAVGAAIATRTSLDKRLLGGAVVALLALGVVPFWRDERAVADLAAPIVSEFGSMGAVIRHRPAIVLAGDSGYAFAFYADLTVTPWPAAGDLKLEALQGHAPRDPAKRLAELRSRDGADVFVVNALVELDRQPDLRALLDRLPVLYRSPTAIIFQLPPRAT